MGEEAQRRLKFSRGHGELFTKGTQAIGWQFISKLRTRRAGNPAGMSTLCITMSGNGMETPTG
jgi:hypothetical protein